MATNLQELRLLLELLEEKGVMMYRDGELELTLSPQFPGAREEEPTEEEERGWQNTTLEERQLLGCS